MRLFCIVAALALLSGPAATAAGCTFAPSRLNDDFCDCERGGEDEPLTSACSPVGTFACADRRGVSSVPSSRVGDGVCDCCDGSDEALGTCGNVCEEQDRKDRLEREAREKVRKEGEAAFAQLAVKAKELMCGSISKEDDKNKKQEKDEDKVSEEELKAASEKVKSLEEAEEEDKLASRISSLQLDSISKDDLQRILVKLAAQTSSGVSLERMVAESASCGGGESEKHRGNKGEDGDYAAEEQAEDASEEDEAEKNTGDCDPVWEDIGDSEELQKARTDLELLEQRAGKKAEEIVPVGDENAVDDSKLDFGPGNVWRALKNECFSLKKEQYTYELCVFGQFKQDHTRLGRFSQWTPPYSGMLYDHGDMCFSPAVARSVRVKISCGASSRLVDVSEPSTCVYEAVFETPAACIPEGFASGEDASIESMCAATTS